MHRILERQLKKHLKGSIPSIPAWEDFIRAVSDTYCNFDEDRELNERSQEISTRELKEAEEKFKRIAETSELWIWEVNKDGLYIYSSRLIEKILGYKPEEVIGKKYFYDFFVQGKREDLKKKAFDIFSAKKRFKNFINLNVRKDGNMVLLETSGSPVLDKEGNLLGYLGADEDVTERCRAQERQQILLKDMEDMNKIMVGRELKMIELKKEINRLSQELGRPVPYDEVP